jgi:hypothetical protein
MVRRKTVLISASATFLFANLIWGYGIVNGGYCRTTIDKSVALELVEKRFREDERHNPNYSDDPMLLSSKSLCHLAVLTSGLNNEEAPFLEADCSFNPVKGSERLSGVFYEISTCGVIYFRGGYTENT